MTRVYAARAAGVVRGTAGWPRTSFGIGHAVNDGEYLRVGGYHIEAGVADEANFARLGIQFLQQLNRYRFAHVDGEHVEATHVDGRRVLGSSRFLVGRDLAGGEELPVAQGFGAAQRLAGGVHQQAHGLVFARREDGDARRRGVGLGNQAAGTHEGPLFGDGPAVCAHRQLVDARNVPQPEDLRLGAAAHQGSAVDLLGERLSDCGVQRGIQTTKRVGQQLAGDLEAERQATRGDLDRAEYRLAFSHLAGLLAPGRRRDGVHGGDAERAGRGIQHSDVSARRHRRR